MKNFYVISCMFLILAATGTVIVPLPANTESEEVEAEGHAPLCFGQHPTNIPTGGPDIILGTSGNDVLYGGGGADTIIGRGGNDRLCGGGSNDFICGDDAFITETDFFCDPDSMGNDRISGGSGNDDLSGAGGIDRIRGGTGADCIRGQNGDDFLRGGADNDFLSGGADFDHLFGDDGFDICINGEDTFGCEPTGISLCPP